MAKRIQLKSMGEDAYPEMYYKAGDSVSLAGVAFAAYVTSGSTEIRFFVPLQKLKKSSNTATITATSISALGTSGAIFSSKPSSDFTISEIQVNGAKGGILFSLKNIDGSAFNATNNTAATLYITSSNSVLSFS